MRTGNLCRWSWNLVRARDERENGKSRSREYRTGERRARKSINHLIKHSRSNGTQQVENASVVAFLFAAFSIYIFLEKVGQMQAGNSVSLSLPFPSRFPRFWIFIAALHGNHFHLARMFMNFARSSFYYLCKAITPSNVIISPTAIGAPARNSSCDRFTFNMVQVPTAIFTFAT